MNFKLLLTPEIYFGVGAVSHLPKVMQRFGTKSLWITGGASFDKLHQSRELQSYMNTQGMDCSIERLSGEPSTLFIDTIADKYRGMGIDCIVSVGGGSVIDAGKTLSALLGVEGSVEQYLEGIGNKEYVGRKTPMIAVTTCSGTGSETTLNAVVSKVGANGYKRSMRHLALMPNVAIVDPALTVTCPPSVTGNSGLDAFTQLLESYLSPTATSFTDSLVFDALLGMPKALKNAYADGSSLPDRTTVAYGAMISGLGLTNAGLGLVHGFASVIGGFYHIPHGVICGTLLPAIINKSVHKMIKDRKRYHTALNKMAKVGKLFGAQRGFGMVDYCLQLTNSLYDLAETLNIPKLGSYGMGMEDVEKIVTQTGHKNHPVKLELAELSEILSERI
ncbi:MAG TPA: alcohol dehydrogenase [Bacteroidales bacterium]|nr:alcohol dehydrogenase [Bacteroidales bacterium]